MDLNDLKDLKDRTLMNYLKDLVVSNLSGAGLYSAVKYFDSVKTATCVEI
jgi:hypothetical protein